MKDGRFVPLELSTIRDAERQEIQYPEDKWRRVFVWADMMGEPVLDEGREIGQVIFEKEDVEVATLAIVKTNHQVVIYTCYDDRLIQYKD